MDLQQMPGTGQGGYAGYRPGEQLLPRDLRHCGGNESDQCRPDGRTDGGGTSGPYGYYQPNQWATAAQTAGSAASAQMGAMGQQRLNNGMDRPSTIEIRPGYQFDVMVTEDLVLAVDIRHLD
jgi:type IV secretion system protein TrbI